ncbi:Fibronectin-binding protein [Clostridiaceae bacterium BL-3]|nr:Fibronectin-binding protein [Clostridiaceae bacterium BL-3]
MIFKNIEYGSYVIKETEAPSGYYLSSKVLDASITADGSTVYARPEGDTGTGVYSLSDTRITGGGSVGI